MEFIEYIFLAQSESIWKVHNLYVNQFFKPKSMTYSLTKFFLFCIHLYANPYIFIKITFSNNAFSKYLN